MVYSFLKPNSHCQTPSSPSNKNRKFKYFGRELWFIRTCLLPAPLSWCLAVLRRPIDINLFGCINGIICIGGPLAPYLSVGSGCLGVSVLWNLAIRERKIIRCPPLPQRFFLPPYKVTTLYAFGYDQYSSDYKVVRIVTYNKNSPPTQNSLFTYYYNFFHVYSLNADSWTLVIDTTIHRSNLRLLSYYAMYFNCVNHWLGFFDNGHINELG